MTSFRRLLLLLVLVPQVLALGLGRGSVLCVSGDGHVQIEALSSACCTDGASRTSDAAGRLGRSASDCEACTDLRVTLDSQPQRVGERLAEPSATAIDAPDPAPRRAASRARFAARSERALVPPHLIRLRGVLLRC
jgi:hypothetical protein